MISRSLLCSLAAVLLAVGLSGCADDTDDFYSNYRAFFRYNYVLTTPPLLTAVGNPGMFCAINFPNGNYHFVSSDGKNTYDYRPTAMDQYGKPECVAGFIVGMPNIPDFSGQFAPVAYDLVCPECFTSTSIQRSLSIAQNGWATCSRCNRSYDLNNGGIVVQGEAGRKLLRYHVAYSPAQGVLVIQN